MRDCFSKKISKMRVVSRLNFSTFICIQMYGRRACRIKKKKKFFLCQKSEILCVIIIIIITINKILLFFILLLLFASPRRNFCRIKNPTGNGKNLKKFSIPLYPVINLQKKNITKYFPGFSAFPTENFSLSILSRVQNNFSHFVPPKN